MKENTFGMTKKKIKVEENETLTLIDKFLHYNCPDFIEKYPEFIKQILGDGTPSSGCPLTSNASKDERWNNKEFYLALAKVTLSKERGKITANVQIPQNPFLAIKKEQRFRMEYEKFENYRGGRNSPYPAYKEIENLLNIPDDGELETLPPMLMRMTAGGCIGLIRCLREDTYEKIEKGERELSSLNLKSDADYIDYIILAQKDEKAPSYKFDLSPASGLSEAVEHLDNPALIVVGEFAEEIRILNRKLANGNKDIWIYPNYKEASLIVRDNIIRESRIRYAELFKDNWQNTSYGINGYIEEGPYDREHRPFELINLGNDKLTITTSNNAQKTIMTLNA